MTIEVTDLGRWGAALLVAEYDAEADAIRVDARAVACVRRALGDAEADRFTAAAIAHEAYHRAHPDATEADAHAAAAAVGCDPARYERLLRAALRA